MRIIFARHGESEANVAQSARRARGSKVGESVPDVIARFAPFVGGLGARATAEDRTWPVSSPPVAPASEVTR